MADNNITLKRITGSGTSDNLYPRTNWDQVLNKPTTFTPTSHTHGNITNAGVLNNSPVTVGTGDFIVIGDTSTAAVERSTIAFGTATTTFLRNDGAWATPAGAGNVSTNGTITANTIPYWVTTTSIGTLATSTYPSLTELSYVKGVTSAIQTQINNKVDVITKYRATSQSASSTVEQTVTSITLLANNYYHLDVTGMWSKSSTSANTAPVISIAVDNVVGTPTINGRFEWLNTSSATAYTVSNTNGSILTNTTARGFTAATAITAAITTTPFGLKAFFYAGTSNKILTFYVRQSSSASGVVSVDNISITATKVVA
jgi:hypothetical protein